MPRGRQYYDPIIQVPGKVEGAQDLSRVEVFQDESLQWNARQVAADGSLTGDTIQNFAHDGLMKQILEKWPHLPIYELRNEAEDSTWEGHGPSPRLWQVPGAVATEIPPAVDPPLLDNGDSVMGGPEPGFDYDGPQPNAERIPLRLIPVNESGSYVLLSDILRLLEMWAVSYEVDKNPSGALALREAADALKDIG